MTHPLSLVLWMATAQTAGEPATAPGPTATPASVVVQCPPSAADRTLQAQLDEARAQLDKALRDAAEAKEQVAKLKEEAGMPAHALAALLVSDRPKLARLKEVVRRHNGGAGSWRLRHVEQVVYTSTRPDETMTALVLTLRNPPEAPTWEPKEAFIRAPYYCGDPPIPVALQSSPVRIRPGETAQVALVFDRVDLRLDEPYAIVTLFRDGEWDMEFAVQPSDFRVASTKSGEDR